MQNLLSTYLFLFQGDNTAARKNCHNDSETNPLFVPLTHIPEEKATHIEGGAQFKKFTAQSSSRALPLFYILLRVNIDVKI